MSQPINLKTQLRQNLLAIISIVIALSALSYNSWRNEKTERNRNLRAAGFEIMRETAHLQLIIDTATYSENTKDTDAIKGWVSINLIMSLSELMPTTIKDQAFELKQVWSDNWSSLYDNKAANEAVTQSNLAMVMSVKQQLIKLD